MRRGPPGGDRAPGSTGGASPAHIVRPEGALPHEAWDPVIRGHTEDVLGRGAPRQGDLADALQRMRAGERW